LGFLLVAYMAAHPLRMDWYLFGATLVFCGLVAALVALFRGKVLLIAVPLALVGLVAGWLGMTKVVLARKDPRPVPELTRAKDDAGLGHTAVVYFTHGEPETYDPIGWVNQFNEFDEQGIPFIPLIARPFFFKALRDKYLEVGRSDHVKVHGEMIRSLEAAYREEGDSTTKFYLSFLDANPRPDAAVVQALNEGASKIVIAEVFLTISNHTAEGEHQIQQALEGFDTPVEYSGPLYDSDILKSMFVERANANIGDTDKSEVGILLVGHGQPDEWDVEWPTETAQEIGFREDVLGLLAQDGYDADNLSLAWMDFKEPKPAPKIEQFVDQGVEKLLFFSAAISADAIHSQYDVPDLVHQAQVPDDFEIVDLGAWNNDPIVIRAIKDKIDPLME
jgi:sirohydrochlorin ferrochelatase